MKMAVVGCEASGKTVFMCALADYFGRAAADNPMRLKLTPENAAANSFERYQFRQMRCLRQWPPATPPNRTVEVKWSLRRDGKPLAYIDMLEFGGETFRAAFRESTDGDKASQDASVRELTNYLSGADFFVVLVSIKSLMTDAGKASDEDYERETEALWVTRGILEFIRKHRPKAGVVIGLTQADRYRNEIGEAGGAAKLFAALWPTIGSAAQGYPVVEVASVSKTDAEGNPAPDYRTHGVLPVMQAFSRHCFGDENALENGSDLQPRKLPRKPLVRPSFLVSALSLGALAAGALMLTSSRPSEARRGAGTVVRSEPVVIEKIVEKTNTIEKVVVETVTNNVKILIDRPVTNTVEKIVEKTNTITNVLEKVVERPVTNTVEKIVERTNTITNVLEKVVERPVTNTVEKVVEKIVEVEASAEEQPTTSYRTWTDYNGRKIVARWVDSNPAQDVITIVNRNGRRIDAVLHKFSQADRAYIKSELVRHAELGEIMQNGNWVKDPSKR